MKALKREKIDFNKKMSNNSSNMTQSNKNQRITLLKELKMNKLRVKKSTCHLQKKLIEHRKDSIKVLERVKSVRKLQLL